MNYSNLIRTFNCDDMLNSYDDHRSVSYIEELLKNKQYFPNVPGFQTNIDIFKEQDVVWKKYEDSLVRSVKQYVNADVNIIDISAWAYKSNIETNFSRDILWHDHLFSDDNIVDQTLPNKILKGQKLVCAIYYLKISSLDDANVVGTEFDINGNRFFIKPVKNSWVLFEPNLLHRSGITNYERCILAADIIYETSY